MFLQNVLQTVRRNPLLKHNTLLHSKNATSLSRGISRTICSRVSSRNTTRVKGKSGTTGQHRHLSVKGRNVTYYDGKDSSQLLPTLLVILISGSAVSKIRCTTEHHLLQTNANIIHGHACMFFNPAARVHM